VVTVQGDTASSNDDHDDRDGAEDCESELLEGSAVLREHVEDGVAQ